MLTSKRAAAIPTNSRVQARTGSAATATDRVRMRTIGQLNGKAKHDFRERQAGPNARPETTPSLRGAH